MATNASAPAGSTDTVATETNGSMWQLVTEWVQVDEEEWLLQEMVQVLADPGITKPFQLQKAPDALLERIFPLAVPYSGTREGYTERLGVATSLPNRCPG